MFNFFHSHLVYCDFTMSLNDESLKIKKTEEIFNSKFKEELCSNFVISMAWKQKQKKIIIILIKKKTGCLYYNDIFSDSPI